MLITPQKFLEIEIKAGLTADNERFVKLARLTAEQLEPFKALRMVDYGAGTGVYSSVMHGMGYNVKAYDIWREHRIYMVAKYPDLQVISELTRFDFMLFIEVAEHMTDDEIVQAIEAIQPNYILFSSTSEKTPNDANWGHINVKEQKEWVRFWQGLGYKKTKPLKYPTTWTILLEKI